MNKNKSILFNFLFQSPHRLNHCCFGLEIELEGGGRDEHIPLRIQLLVAGCAVDVAFALAMLEKLLTPLLRRLLQHRRGVDSGSAIISTKASSPQLDK